MIIEDYEFMKGEIVAIGDNLYKVTENDLVEFDIYVLQKGEIIRIGDNVFRVTEDGVEEIEDVMKNE